MITIITHLTNSPRTKSQLVNAVTHACMGSIYKYTYHKDSQCNVEHLHSTVVLANLWLLWEGPFHQWMMLGSYRLSGIHFGRMCEGKASDTQLSRTQQERCWARLAIYSAYGGEQSGQSGPYHTSYNLKALKDRNFYSLLPINTASELKLHLKSYKLVGTSWDHVN